MNEKSLACYMGYAFSQAVNLQHLLSPGDLAVPYVVYWKGEEPTPVPYPAATQQEAVEKAQAARIQYLEGTGWSSGREGLIDQGNGTKLDALLIEGWVPGLAPPVELLVYYLRGPFRLIKGFMWKGHPQARKDPRAFMAEFQRGILLQPFGRQCMEYIERAEVLKAGG